MRSSIVLVIYSSLLPQSSPRQWRRPSRTYSLNSHPVAILYVALATRVSLFLLCVLSALCVLCATSLSISRRRSLDGRSIFHLNRDSCSQTLNRPLVRLPADFHQICLRHMGAGFHQLLR